MRNNDLFDGLAPDPREILRKANQDRNAVRYHDSLEKLSWLFENKATVSSDSYGIRRSFVLSSWFKLAERFPPAMDRLKFVRDIAIENVNGGVDVLESFKDLVAITERLKEHKTICSVFHTLHEEQPDNATLVYRYAENALIAEGHYATCLHYFDPQAATDSLISRFRRFSTSRRSMSSQGQKSLERRLLQSAGTIVAMLSVAKQIDEATELAKRFSDLFGDNHSQSVIQSSLQGVFPNRFSSRVPKKRN